MQTVLTLKQEINKARRYNFLRRVEENYNELAEERKDNLDIFIQICNGQLREDAITLTRIRKQLGMYDSMFMPVEVNL